MEAISHPMKIYRVNCELSFYYALGFWEKLTKSLSHKASEGETRKQE